MSKIKIEATLNFPRIVKPSKEEVTQEIERLYDQLLRAEVALNTASKQGRWHLNIKKVSK